MDPDLSIPAAAKKSPNSALVERLGNSAASFRNGPEAKAHLVCLYGSTHMVVSQNKGTPI